MDWNNVYITDKSGKKFWNTTASPMSTVSEIKNLRRHLDNAARHPEHYGFLDLATAHICENGQTLNDMTDDELLAELGV